MFHLFLANCTQLSFIGCILDQSGEEFLPYLKHTEIMGSNTKKMREVPLADKTHRKVSAIQTPCSHQLCSAQAIKMHLSHCLRCHISFHYEPKSN